MEKDLKITSCMNCNHMKNGDGFCELLKDEIPDFFIYGNWRYIPSNCPLKNEEKSNGSED